MPGAASKKKLENKVALLQDHFKGGGKQEEDLDSGEWSPENIKRRREQILRRETPWVLEGMTISEWYDQRIKPLQETQAA